MRASTTARVRVCILQGWQTERVVQRNASSGRVLLVLPRDPSAHQRKARPSACLPGPCSKKPGKALHAQLPAPVPHAYASLEEWAQG